MIAVGEKIGQRDEPTSKVISLPAYYEAVVQSSQ